MLKTVRVKDLMPNPFRRLDEYPILREKVDALKDSIASTGFWGTIVGRFMEDGTVEIAFGHHRRVALQEAYDDNHEVEVIVRDLTNEDMIRMMARENMEEWGTSAWVELETIRATIKAYAEGKIELPKADARGGNVRVLTLDSVSKTYTKASVAQFLEWTKKNHKTGLQPNAACEVAFDAIDLLDRGLLKESDLKGLSRDMMRKLVEGIQKIQRAEKEEAKLNRQSAQRAKEQAATVAEPKEQERYKKQATIFEEQAEQHDRAADKKPATWGQTAAEQLRGGAGVRAIREDAATVAASINKTDKIYVADGLAREIAKQLENLARKDDKKTLLAKLNALRSCKGDLSPHEADGLCQSIDVLITMLESWKTEFSTSSDPTRWDRSSNGHKSITR